LSKKLVQSVRTLDKIISGIVFTPYIGWIVSFYFLWIYNLVIYFNWCSNNLNLLQFGMDNLSSGLLYPG
jgi:hypothetical protein